MISLNRNEADLVLVAAVFARNVYNIHTPLDEFCDDHDLNYPMFKDRLAIVSVGLGWQLLESRGSRWHVTEQGFAHLISNLDEARRLAEKVGDVLASMALESPLSHRILEADPSLQEREQLSWSYDSFSARFASEEGRGTLSRLLRRAYDELDRSEAGNAQVAQAKAFIESALILAECPEPQSDLVWEICQRLSNMAGIGSLIVATLALFFVA